MRNNADGLKRIEAVSKKFLSAENKGTVEEFRQYVFEDIFRKKMGYDRSSTMN